MGGSHPPWGAVGWRTAAQPTGKSEPPCEHSASSPCLRRRATLGAPDIAGAILLAGTRVVVEIVGMRRYAGTGRPALWATLEVCEWRLLARLAIRLRPLQPEHRKDEPLPVGEVVVPPCLAVRRTERQSGVILRGVACIAAATQ